MFLRCFEVRIASRVSLNARTKVAAFEVVFARQLRISIAMDWLRVLFHCHFGVGKPTFSVPLTLKARDKERFRVLALSDYHDGIAVSGVEELFTHKKCLYDIVPRRCWPH